MCVFFIYLNKRVYIWLVDCFVLFSLFIYVCFSFFFLFFLYVTQKCVLLLCCNQWIDLCGKESERNVWYFVWRRKRWIGWAGWWKGNDDRQRKISCVIFFTFVIVLTHTLYSKYTSKITSRPVFLCKSERERWQKSGRARNIYKLLSKEKKNYTQIKSRIVNYLFSWVRQTSMELTFSHNIIFELHHSFDCNTRAHRLIKKKIYIYKSKIQFSPCEGNEHNHRVNCGLL